MATRITGTIVWAIALLGCRAEVLHEISEPEANAVLSALQSEGITAKKLRVTQGSHSSYTISVPNSQAPQAWDILREQNLPRPKPQGFGDIFGDVGLVPTATQEQALMRHALAGELSRTLSALAGVQEARVHIVLPAKTTLADPHLKEKRPRAAVLLNVTPGTKIVTQDIKELVAGSVDGLATSNVAVVVANAGQRALNGPSTGSRSSPLVSVGAIEVTPRSRPIVMGAIVIGLSGLVGLTLALLLLIQRNRTLKQRLNAAHRAKATDRAPYTSDVPPTAADNSLGLIERSLHHRRGATQVGKREPQNRG